MPETLLTMAPLKLRSATINHFCYLVLGGLGIDLDLVPKVQTTRPRPTTPVNLPIPSFSLFMSGFMTCGPNRPLTPLSPVPVFANNYKQQHPLLCPTCQPFPQIMVVALDQTLTTPKYFQCRLSLWYFGSGVGKRPAPRAIASLDILGLILSPSYKGLLPIAGCLLALTAKAPYMDTVWPVRSLCSRFTAPPYVGYCLVSSGCSHFLPNVTPASGLFTCSLPPRLVLPPWPLPPSWFPPLWVSHCHFPFILPDDVIFGKLLPCIFCAPLLAMSNSLLLVLCPPFCLFLPRCCQFCTFGVDSPFKAVQPSIVSLTVPRPKSLRTLRWKS
ncbi:unnamed protein product [Lepeophtheirus salmonis]|uniref:(salmon louse) hypothetical protein n=1 Tax=Lepeophtheirus salmonis TaxID=72036 RepID=A0A7R8CTY8_LEPSM|nr:unnamed protein product [Lepeophtheirus salmonis]CAF2894799.1 unnamed protein product [Lepeophtheirus salmonis]